MAADISVTSLHEQSILSECINLLAAERRQHLRAPDGKAGMWERRGTAYEEDEPNWPLDGWQLDDRVTCQTHNQRQVPRMLVYL